MQYSESLPSPKDKIERCHEYSDEASFKKEAVPAHIERQT